MIVVATDLFRKEQASLPSRIQAKLASLLTIFERNYRDPRLPTKKLRGDLSGLYSFRIVRDYRLIFSFYEQETIVLHTIKHLKDIYR